MNYATFKEVAPASGAKLDLAPEDNIWHLNLDKIESHTGRVSEKEYSPYGKAGSSTFVFDENNVLYSKLRPYLNKVICPDERGVGTTELVPMKPDPDRLDRRYLSYYLRSSQFLSWVNQQVAGAKMPRVSMKVFWDHEIPLPPLPEQRRIADILDKADSIRRRRQEAIALSEEFLRSVFLDMFGDPVTNPKGWDVKEIREVAYLKIGPFGSLLHKEDYVQNGIPLVNPKHMKDLKIVPDPKVSITKEKHEELNQYHLAGGDIVMARRGDIGRCALVSECDNGYLCGTGSLFLRPNSSITPQYLLHLISSEALVASLTNCAKGVTMLNLNAGAVGELTIPVPSVEKQLEFSSIIKKFKTFQNKLASGFRDGNNLSQSVSSNLLS